MYFNWGAPNENEPIVYARTEYTVGFIYVTAVLCVTAQCRLWEIMVSECSGVSESTESHAKRSSSGDVDIKMPGADINSIFSYTEIMRGFILKELSAQYNIT